MRETHGLEGCEIIWLLVNVHNFRADLAHNLAQLRVIMQVKVAIQSHRCDNHAIAARVEAFEHLFTAIVALPVLGRHQR